MAVDEPRYPIASVSKALQLLLMLKEHERVRIADVSSALSVAPSTAHRMLSMFQQFGFVTQESPGRAYVLGPAFEDLARSLAVELDLCRCLRPVLESLAAEIGESVHLATLRGRQSLFIDCVQGAGLTQAASRKGIALPSYATASGKAMLAALPPDVLARLFPTKTLPSLTRNTLKTRDAVYRELRLTRDRGYAVNDSESLLDFGACAVPVVAADGKVAAAIAVAGPTARFSQRYKERIAVEVRSAATMANAALSAGGR